MVALSLKIGVGNVVKTMQFEPSTMVYDACRIIRERVPEAQLGQPNDYSLFLSDEDPKKGIWLEAGKALDYYMLRNGDTLEYKKKHRPLKIRMLDGTVKTVMVDDSKIVSDMLMTICARIDVGEEKKEESMGTLKRDKTLLRDDKKMEKLKQKLHTDDELNWLDHGRTLREQGVEEIEMLLLRRKFFYSDQNVDSRDPVQLNLLYVQARDDILNGSHPVSFEKACDFAGYQCQIQFGDHNETKHKPGFLDLKEFLPKEYIKNKGEKRIFQAHNNSQNMTEIEAKVSYVKLARSLKTYGVSFFLVKESVMRVDEKTKEDFGDYQDGYYSVQTTEGEQIAQLIAGYIDIILKKKKSKDHFGLEGDEESTMLEDSVSPKKSTVMQQQFNKMGRVETGSVALPAIMRSGAGGPENFQMGSMPQAKQHITSGQMHRGHMPPLTSAQQALTGTINSSMQAVNAAQASLDEFDTLPPLGTDAASQAWRKNKMDESKHEIHSQVDAITAGTASMVNLTAGDPADTDYTAVGCAVTTISSNLTEMSKGVKLLAALMEDEGANGQQLLGAAKNLASAVSSMLKTAQPSNIEPRQNLLQAAGNDMLMQLAKAVANAAAALVLKAKNVAQKTEDSAQQNRVVAPTISSPVCQEQLIEASKLVAKSVEGCVEASQGATGDEALLKQVGAAATGVTHALNELLLHIKQYASGTHPIGRHGEATDRILDMVRQARILAQATSDLNAAKQAAAAATQTIAAAQHAASSNKNPAAQQQLVQSCKVVAEQIPQLVQGVRGSQSQPDSPSAQLALIGASQNFLQPGARMATSAKATVPTIGEQASAMQLRAGRLKPLPGETLEKCSQDLVTSTKSVSSAIAQLLSEATQGNENYTGMAARDVAQALRSLATAARGVGANAARGVAKAVSQALNRSVNSLPGQRDVDNAIRAVGEASKSLLADSFPSSGKSFQEVQAQLNQAAAGLNQSANELVHSSRGTTQELARSTSKAVTDSINQLITMCTQQAPGQKECDNALRELEVLGESMAGISHNAKNSNLPEFGDSVSAGSKALCGLTESAAQAAYLVGVSDPNSTAGQKGLVDPSQFAKANQSIQMACQNLVDPACTQSQVLSAATIVAKHTSALCNACRLASSKTSNPVAKRQFVQSAKEVANSTANLALDGAFNPENREKCKAATVPLIEAVDNLTAFASNPEFASVRAQISPETARSLAVNPKDPPKWSVLASHSRTVSDSIKKLITNMRRLLCQRECDDAIDVLNSCIREVDQGIPRCHQPAASGRREDISQEALQEQMMTSVHEISNLIEPVALAAHSEASQLGHKVSQMARYFEPLIMAAIGTASKILSSQQQMAVLDQTKTLAESALQMLYTAKEAGGNPKAAHTQEALEESVLMMKEAVEDLGATLSEVASAAGAVGGMVDSITQAINKMEDPAVGDPDGNFVDYQTTMVKTAKAIAMTVQEMVTKSNTNPDDLGGLANQMTNEFGDLAHEAKYAAITAENEEIGSHIIKQVGELGFSCTSLVTKAGGLQCSPNDSFTKKELIESARKVSEKVSHVLASLQAGNRGTQACITAASAVSGIIADLDTTIMFARAGTLNRENSETFADHREHILKTAKALVEDTKLLVSGAGASQEKLAQAAQSSVLTITKLADVVKLGAASLGAEDPETQVVLINAVKDAVEDEATKGTRALEATIEHIKQELVVFNSHDPPPKTATPEEFIRMTKGITMATAKAVAAGNSCRQEDVIATANLSRRAIADMLHSCKIIQKPTHDQKQKLAVFSKRVAGSVTELIQAAEAMKGTEWVDPEDPTVIAENELLGAAAAIEAAAKKLEQLRPRTKPKEADESLNFEEQILEAAKSIAAATSALVKAASAAQRELVAQGKVGVIQANAVDDGQWSQGLISAAANSAVQGHASEEKLISSAKQVAASTAQLLVACKVKADQDSQTMKRLQNFLYLYSCRIKIS
ncbi:hypothetical protein CRUP_023093 [Coryphaenoides rupestris]|nr:hypothetical protein CRUP_023093 [Coryphaenoides rupestris]